MKLDVSPMKSKTLIAVVAISSIISSAFSVLVTQAIVGRNYNGGGHVSSPSVLVNPQSFTSDESQIVDSVAKADKAVVAIVITKEVPKFEQIAPQMQQNPFGSLFGFDPFSMFQVPQYRQNGTEEKEIGGGSGFFVNNEGLLVSNRHVVSDKDASYTAILNDGSKVELEVAASDPVVDIAVLKPKTKQNKVFPFITFADSEKLMLGQRVIAIGNALGEFRNSVSMGVVSGLARSIAAGNQNGGNVEQLERVIQTDAAINTGNSGGPLLNSSGDVIGVNVAVAQGSQNIGFAIPANVVVDIVNSVSKYGKIVRPFLGVRYIPIDKQLKEANNLAYDYGVLVQRGVGQSDIAVVPGSPADKAGIVENDIILKVDGKKIDEKNSLSYLIRNKKVGDVVSLTISSKEKEKTVSVTLETAKE